MTEPRQRTPLRASPAAESGTSDFDRPRGLERLMLVLDLAGAQPPAGFDCRPVAPSDTQQLAELMLDAYRGTVDYNGETLADALKEVECTLSGSYGRFLPECSFVVAGEDELASATLVTLPGEGRPDKCPLLAFAMTRKCHQRQGMSAALVRRSAAALREWGYSRVELVVTAANAPARRLYARLGFQPVRNR